MTMRQRKDRGPKLWDKDPNRARIEKSRKRALVIYSALIFCFFAVFVRLSFLTIFDHEALSAKADNQYRRIKTLEPQRGVIWDRHMRQLAVSVDASSLYAIPSRISDVKSISTQLASVIRVPKERIARKILSKKDKDFVWLSRKMNEKTSFRVGRLKDRLKGQELGMIAETRRYYPKGRVASNIIGYTNVDNEGIDGVELTYNDYIKGSSKKIFLGRDARGHGLAKGIEDGLRGNDLILTIDETIQYFVEKELDTAMAEWEAESAAAIMMRPYTGEILALANRPTYDSNAPGSVSVELRRNRAITDLYEPGSTFKAFLAAAAIEESVVAPGEIFDVSKGYIRVPGGVIRDVHRNEQLTFREVFKKSSNVGSVMIGEKLGEERYYRYITRFGFGRKTGLDLSGEANGILRRTEQWSGRSLASLSIGQEIGITPLQLLRAYCAIANGGELLRPYLVSRILSPSGAVVKSFSPRSEGRVISESTARTVRDILKSVVEDGGTAEKAYILGNLVAGKTGTAQMVDPETGRYSTKDYISSFVGFVPADRPEVALIVVIYKPRGARYGGVVAAPVFRRVVEQALVYLNIPMERKEGNVVLVSTSQ